MTFEEMCLDTRIMRAIAEMGFDHVRVPVDYNILETEDGTPIESGYELLDRVTDWCRENKLNMILDMHNEAHPRKIRQLRYFEQALHICF